MHVRSWRKRVATPGQRALAPGRAAGLARQPGLAAAAGGAADAGADRQSLVGARPSDAPGDERAHAHAAHQFGGVVCGAGKSSTYCGRGQRARGVITSGAGVRAVVGVFLTGLAALRVAAAHAGAAPARDAARHADGPRAVWKSTSASGAPAMTLERRGAGIATPSSRCRVDGVEADERAVKF